MDNVSHSLAGVAVAEALLRLGARRGLPLPPGLPRVAWVTSVVAQNLPDADFVYVAVTGGKLGYLLHHRGHTHTLAVGLPLALLALLVPWAWGRLAGRAWGRGAWGLFALLALLGPLGHLMLDGTNNYGVHPFWPWDARWRYGDSIFIIEPAFWVWVLALLRPAAEARWARWGMGLLLVGMLGVCWAVPFVPWPLALGLSLAGGALAWGAGRLAPGVRVGLAAGLSAATFATFSSAHPRAHAAVTADVAARWPGWQLHDVVLTPLPVNPACWEALAVLTGPDGTYALRRARVGAWPEQVPAAACPPFALAAPTTAPLVPLPDASGAGAVAWQDGYALPLAALRELARTDCRAAAFLRFARAPFLVPGAPAVLGDLRYDREVELGFAELALPPGEPACPRLVPPWTPPRADVLGL